ncbi:MAG: SH3 domain-containing protein [Chloroflexota bacterium]
MRRWSILLILSLLFTMPTLAQTDTDDWTIWAFEADSGRAFHVTQVGVSLYDVILPIPDTFVTASYAPNIAVSPDGTRVAYGVTGVTADDEQVSAFIIYDTALDRILSTYNTPNYAIVSSLTFSTVAWNDSGSVVAFAYASGTDEASQAWRIIVLNATDARIVTELDNTASYFAEQEELLAPFLLPILQFYNDAILGFNLIPYQTADFSAELLSYEWDVVTGRIIQTNRAPRITGDTLAQTGETISPIVDERVNFDADFTPYTNALHIYRPEIGARAPFFATRTYDLLSAQFIQNGEQVVAYAEDLLTFERTHLLINRNGVLQGLPTLNAVNNRLIGTPDGFAYMADNPTPALLHVDTRDSALPQRLLWSAPDFSRFVPMWVTPRPQEDYNAWIQLAPPIFPTQLIVRTNDSGGIDPDAVPTTAGIGGGSSVITVDSIAIISTTSGDRLNMRNQAGLSGTIIARLDSGTRVVITDGPISADGFIWWEVRLSTGQVGWVVERAEGVQTLVPGN